VSALRFPCTGHVDAHGFGAFLEQNLAEPRANLRAFARDLSGVFHASHVTLTNSGSSANLAAALALTERAHGRRRALASGFTFPTTLSSLSLAGFEPFLVDTERDGFDLDPSALERAMNDDVALVCVTHFLGYPAQLEAIAAIARRHGALVLVDACESMMPHAHADATTYSFYHPHHLSSYGGGAVVTHDRELARVLESVTHWGRACSHHVDDADCAAPEGIDHNFWYVRRGQNLEMSELNAAFGRFSLQTIAEDEAARRARFEILYRALSEVRSLRVHPAPGRSPFVFPITVRDGDARPLADRLLARGVEVRSLMGGAMSRQPAFRDLQTDGLEHCESIARASVFVGIHQTLPLDDVHAVARIVVEEASR